MKIKTAILSGASALVLAPAAFAADLPVVAEPVNYVAACDSFGQGYFKLPGQDTCVKIHGRIRTQWTSHNLTKDHGVLTEAADAVTHKEAVATFENGSDPEFSKFTRYISYTKKGSGGTPDETKHYAVDKDGKFVDEKGAVLGTQPDLSSDSPTFTGAVEVAEMEVLRARTVEDKAAVEEERNDYSAYARGYLYFESMTSTEFAMIKTYTELTATWDDHDTATSGIGNAWVQLGFDKVSLTVGRLGSSWDDFGGYSNIGTVGITEGGGDPLQIQLAAELGHGFTAQFGIEDSNDTKGATNRVNFAGKFAVTQGMFSATVSGVANAYDADNYGYAVAGHAEIKPLDNLAFGFGASYGQSALNHLGLSGVKGFTNAGEAKGYVFAGGMELGLTDKLTAALDGSYAVLEQDKADYNVTKVNGSLAYKPVAGLDIVLDAGYSTDSMKAKNAQVTGRLQYSF